MICKKCKNNIQDTSLYCQYCGCKQTGSPASRKALKRPNGSGTVYKLQGRRRRPWVAAKNRVIIGYYTKKTDALEALNGLAGRVISDNYNLTFEGVFRAWSKEHYKGLTKSGISQYDISFKVFSPLHKRVFRTLRTSDYQSVIDQHMGKARSTVAKYKQLITQMSQWAIREELITTNFASFVRLPEPKKVEREIFADTEIAALEADGSDAARIVLMLIYTGMRIGELFAARLDDYHQTYVVGGEKTEAGRNRVIPIRPEGRTHFAHFARLATGDLLLSGYSGQRVAANYRRRDYYPLLERLGIRKLNPHCTRHTYASWARRSGMRPEILQRILGHQNYSTTAEIYVHTDIDELIRAVDMC